jgi:DNA ligase-1
MLKVPYGKNIGRSNQTTAWEQAVSEAQSKWEKKQLSNYRQSLDDAIQLLPMLAHKYSDHKQRVTWPCYCQPKMNVVRCLAVIKNGSVTYYSRKGKQYETLSHWNDELQSLFPDGTILDGEAFHPDLNFQEIVRRVKRVKTSRSNIEDVELQFWIYDVINDQPYKDRYGFLMEQMYNKDLLCIKNCPTYPIESEQQLKVQHQMFTQQGFEGTIIRNSAGLYRTDYRSYDLLKYKDFLDEEFEIIGGRSAQGRDEGTVVFECKTDTGQVFNVRPRGTWERRKEYLDCIEQHIGQMLTVRFQEKSEDGVPIFPVGLEIRDFE